MLGLPSRKAFLILSGFREKGNKFTRKGTATHRSYFKTSKTLSSYGINNFYKDLYQGKAIEIKEIGVCSSKVGLRGHIDHIRLVYLGNNEFDIQITELKPKYDKNYIMQLAGYCQILSDPRCKIVYKSGKKTIARLLYPDKPLILSIHGRFIYYKTEKQYVTEWVNFNEMSKILLGVLVKSKKLRSFMRARINDLASLPLCDWCFMYPCGFRDICDKFPYVKDKQTYFGSTKLLKKTPNRIS
jgi:hypothetical protein